jgi:hypothetical protein
VLVLVRELEVAAAGDPQFPVDRLFAVKPDQNRKPKDAGLGFFG